MKRRKAKKIEFLKEKEKKYGNETNFKKNDQSWLMYVVQFPSPPLPHEDIYMKVLKV